MKQCNKCTRTLPLTMFHMELRRGVRKHKARCKQCVQGEWASYKRKASGKDDLCVAFNGWHGPVSPNLGLRP